RVVGEPAGNPGGVAVGVYRRSVRPVGEVGGGRRGDVVAGPESIVGGPDFDHRRVVGEGVAAEGQHLGRRAIPVADAAGRIRVFAAGTSRTGVASGAGVSSTAGAVVAGAR